MAKKSGNGKYFVYFLRCADDTFYTGVTTNLSRRIDEHNEGKAGAKYTKARRPVVLVYSESAKDRSQAQKREHALRSLSRADKQALVDKYS